MTLLEKEPYINGKKFSNSSRPTPCRATEESLRRWREIILTDTTASRFVHETESARQFFAAEKDAAAQIPRSEREEAFYSVKNGFASPVIPAKCIFYILKAYREYRICNLIFRLIPERELHVMFGRNYLANGYTLRDVVCSFCDDRYVPFGENLKRVRFGTYYELYVPAADMAAAVPELIANTIPDERLPEVYADDVGLKLGNEYLGFMSGFHGACNSIYDLRKLV
jgi:hypothetical protein